MGRRKTDDSLRPVFVIDTNILVDYTDLIPANTKDVVKLKEPVVDLEEAHLVIPTAVIRELSSFKKEKSERGKAARTVLRRLRGLIEDELYALSEYYEMHRTIDLANGQSLSILPIPHDFKSGLDFQPAEDDMDGQIILTAMAAKGHLCEIFAGADADRFVTLLTNDNGLAIRARVRGVNTMRFGYKTSEPYTGRREVHVPDSVLERFLSKQRLTMKEFVKALPNEPQLVANEFIVFLADDYADIEGFANVGRYDAIENAIVPLRYADAFPVEPKNVGQVIYAEALMDPNIAAVICSGPAGSGKTFMSTVYGYSACQAGQYIGVTVVPCAGGDRIGALPGGLNEKMDPEVQPFKNALRNYLLSSNESYQDEVARLKQFGAYSWGSLNGTVSLKNRLEEEIEEIWTKWFSNIPIEHARGRDFTYEIALYDEFQDQNTARADTLIKRIGAEGKIVITGDVEQIHEPYLDSGNNGLVYASELLFNNPMVAQVCFSESEVVRHPLVRMVAERQRARREKLHASDDEVVTENYGVAESSLG